MKRNLVLLGICLLAVSFVGEAFGQKKKPRIGIAGIQIENSVFVPNRQPLVGHPVRMPDYLSPDSAMGQAATWLPTQIGYGGGRGPVTKESYDAFVEKTLEMIKANMPYDAFWFYNHGACSVEGVADPEGEFMEKVRSLIGNDVLTTTTMDLHGNTSWLVALNSDLITTYRQAPHADSRESHRRGVVNLLERLESGKGRPAYKAWVAVPVLVSGEWSSTRVEPAKSLYALVPEVEAMPGVIDAGIWIGYVWGDNPRNQGTVMVYGDDEEQVKAGAKKLAQKFWDVRKQFSLEAPGYSLEKCIDLAVASKKKPFFISDMGDNPGGGGSGEVTWTLARLLKRPEFQTDKGKSVLYCSIPGEEVVKQARKVGVGGHVEGMVGAMVDNSYEGPVKLSGTVVYVSPEEDKNAESWRRKRDIAIVKTGSVYVVVGTSSPTPNLEGSGIDPKEMDIVMVKQGYLVTQWYNIQADWVMAFTRGGVDQDFKKLPYKNIVRPMFPIDPDMADPELNIIMVPSTKHYYGR